MAEFRMPALGADMETGRVVQWLVQPGATVKSGDVVAVVETHKGAIDVEIFLDGVISDLAPLDTPLPVGAVLAHVTPAEASPAGVTLSAPEPAPTGAMEARAPVAEVAREPLSQAAVPVSPTATATVRQRISPAARKKAQAFGIDPGTLRGTGVDGAVTLADVVRAATADAKAGSTVQADGAAVPSPAVAPSRGGGFDPAQMRKAIAAAMSRAKREIPHYYLWQRIDFTAASDWLTRWNAERPPEQRLLPAVLLLKATARALQGFPQLNGFYENGAFRPGEGIHIGWAIALRGGGLVAPAIHHADQQALPALMERLRDLVQRARSGGLRSSELTDPTLTVTSLGERGAEGVLGVIYPPQVAIVGFGRVQPQPWVVEGQILVRQVLYVSLAGDHRVSDGHLGGQLLAAIDHALQSPETL